MYGDEKWTKRNILTEKSIDKQRPGFCLTREQKQAITDITFHMPRRTEQIAKAKEITELLNIHRDYWLHVYSYAMGKKIL